MPQDGDIYLNHANMITGFNNPTSTHHFISLATNLFYFLFQSFECFYINEISSTASQHLLSVQLCNPCCFPAQGGCHLCNCYRSCSPFILGLELAHRASAPLHPLCQVHLGSSSSFPLLPLPPRPEPQDLQARASVEASPVSQTLGKCRAVGLVAEWSILEVYRSEISLSPFRAQDTSLGWSSKHTLSFEPLLFSLDHMEKTFSRTGAYEGQETWSDMETLTFWQVCSTLPWARGRCRVMRRPCPCGDEHGSGPVCNVACVFERSYCLI